MQEDDAPVQKSRAAFAARFFDQLHQYKKLLLAYWWIPAVTLTASLGIQWYLLKHAPPAFVSLGRMMVSPKLSIPDANVYSEELNNFYGTQVALMESDSVINRVKLNLQATNSGLNEVPVSINVTLSPKTSIFNLAAMGADPAYTEAYLRATMDEYINLKKDLMKNATTATESGMQTELQRLKADLEDAKQAVIDYQSSNPVVLLEQNGENSAAESLSALNRDLDKNRSELLDLQTLSLDQNLERQRQALPSVGAASGTNGTAQAGLGANDNIGGPAPDALGGFEADYYLEAKRQLLSLQAKRDRLAKTLSESSPELKAVDEDIALQEINLQVYREQSEEQMTNREHIVELHVQELESQVKVCESNALDVSKKISDFDALRDKQKRLQGLYDQMQGNVQTLDVNKGVGQDSVTVLEPASPAYLVPPDTRKHLMMAGLIGLVLGIGILLVINQLDDRIHTFTELEHHFDLPVLGQIPVVQPKDEISGVTILQLDDDRYPLIESYRSMRSAFLYKDSFKHEPKKQPKSIVITSATPNDGKSMTSANFAITLAVAGSRVLLIDGDWRCGQLHKNFSMAATPGLAEVLAGKAEWSKAVVQTSYPNLHLMPRGKQPHLYGNLFASAGKFLKEIEGQYDYYIFDTVPVLVADDVLSLAPHVDGVIMVIRAGFTSSRMANAALELLAQRRANVLGIAFNSVDPKAGDYFHYRHKEYYPHLAT